MKNTTRVNHPPAVELAADNRSVVAPIVSHSGFNLLQIAQYLLVGG